MTGQHGLAAQPRIVAGRYTLLGELGRGGMGVVWRAQDTVIGRQVAIKELHLPDGVPMEERRVLEERVLREARAAGRLNDPAVVTVFDVVVENGMTYIVMELVEAATLSTLISAQGPMPQDRVASIALQTLSALECAHAAGIIHRDVKPGNLMVQPNGRVKLTDFGIAQATDDPRLTTSGSLIGSPAYMSPERIHGHEASPASDLWALGATLCYAIEGVSPYERSSTASTLHAIMNELPRLTRAHGALAAVITGLLMPDPNARLNGPQARAMLERAVAQPTPPHGFGAPASTVQYANSAPAKPNQVRRVLAIVGVVVLAAAMFVGGIYTHRWFTTPSGTVAYTYGEGGQIPVFDMYEDQCGTGSVEPTRQITNDNRVECTESHDFEVYAKVETFDTSSSEEDVSYPGVDVLTGLGQTSCEMIFKSARIQFQDRLKWVALIPTESDWKLDKNKNAQRRIFCVAYVSDNGKLDKTVSTKKS